jgi:hypothetical protein
MMSSRPINPWVSSTYIARLFRELAMGLLRENARYLRKRPPMVVSELTNGVGHWTTPEKWGL